MIHINKITIEGFRSIVKQTTFVFDRPGVNVLIGANGSGKTSVFEALMWTLTDNTMRDSSTSAVVTRPSLTNGDKISCEVSVDLVANGDDYTIIKAVNKAKATSYRIIKNDEELHYQYVNDYKSAIKLILNTSVKQLLATVVMGQSMTRFMSESKATQIEVLDAVFNLPDLNEAKAKAKAKMNDILSRTAELRATLNYNKATIEDKQSLIKQLAKAEANFDKIKAAEIKELKATSKEQKAIYKKAKGIVDKLEKDLKEMTAALATEKIDTKSITATQAKINKITTQRLDAHDQVKAMEIKLKFSDKDISRAKLAIDNIADSCEACGTAYTTESIKEARTKAERILELHLKDKDSINATLLNDRGELRAIDKKLHKLNKKLKELSEVIERTKDLRNAITIATNNLTNNKTICKVRKSAHKDTLANLAKLKASVYQADVDVATIKKDVVELQKSSKQKVKELNSLDRDLELYTYWYKVGFSSAGVKAYVYKQMLIKLNTYLAQYGNWLGLSITMDIDLEAKSKTLKVSIKRAGDDLGESIAYGSLSGGEKTRVDLAIAFSLHELASTTAFDYNILLLDEAFTGLDEAGLNEAFSLIRTLATKGKSVFITSHYSKLNMYDVGTIYFTLDENKHTVIN